MNTSTMTRDERWVLEEKYGGIAKPAYEEDRRRLAAGEPVAYVIGWQPFLGITIHLDSRPLIPRPETEWWTEELLDSLSPAHAPLVFLDLCAGSGAIGCAALSALPQAKVFFGELNPVHAETIRKNIRENSLSEKRADIRTGDLFKPFEDMRFDIIAVNPPYIPSNRLLPDSVRKYEPEEALFGGIDGLSLIRRIAIELPHRLTPQGQVWVECDASHSETACVLFEKSGMKTKILTDQYGAPRVVVVSLR